MHDEPNDDTRHFYGGMPALEMSVNELLASARHFHNVPDDWHVVVTDVKGSTAHVAAGRHEAINLIATGSIIAALNIAIRRGVEIPFFFGGDGATLLVPDPLLGAVMEALAKHHENTEANFSINLRVGSVPMAVLREADHDVLVAKLFRTPVFALPIALGDGLAYAERMIKDNDSPDNPGSVSKATLDLSGMECRWDRIAPPQTRDEIVCLLVNARGNNEARVVFRDVLDHIETVYGPRQQRNPISEEQLRLDPALKTVKQEMQVKLGGFDWRYLAEHWFRTAIVGPGFLRYAKAGKSYVTTIPERSDTLVIDGRINTVISGTSGQRHQLIDALDAMELRGDIVYGVHVCQESIMSCYVRNREDQHIHFVDGADGGYTAAATMLKRKLRH